MKQETALNRVRKICLALPDTKETITWGKPHFRVGDKIFAGCGEEDGKLVLGFKLEMKHAARVVKIPGFWRAPYVGHKGWVSLDTSQIRDWKMVGEMILESYRLIAPKRTLAKLEDEGATERRVAKKKRAVKKVKRKKKAGSRRKSKASQ